ncbi:MAG: Asp23/Gls24 family envelope stress response protein [Gaiellaceae bacterium]
MKGALVFEEEGGRIVVPSQTLATIVSTAVERAGARVRRYPRRSISFDVSDENASLAVGIVAPAGSVLPALSEDVQSAVHEMLTLMCELDRLAVDVTVEEIA